MPFFKTSYFTLFYYNKNWIFGIIHCIHRKVVFLSGFGGFTPPPLVVRAIKTLFLCVSFLRYTHIPFIFYFSSNRMLKQCYKLQSTLHILIKFCPLFEQINGQLKQFYYIHFTYLIFYFLLRIYIKYLLYANNPPWSPRINDHNTFLLHTSPYYSLGTTSPSTIPLPSPPDPPLLVSCLSIFTFLFIQCLNQDHTYLLGKKNKKIFFLWFDHQGFGYIHAIFCKTFFHFMIFFLSVEKVWDRHIKASFHFPLLSSPLYLFNQLQITPE